MGYVAIGQDEGACMAGGGQRLGGELAEGYFVEPTVFSNVANSMTIAREEIFGPVISVIPFDDTDEALRLANDTQYGLGGRSGRKTCHGAQRSKGIRAGTVWVNATAARPGRRLRRLQDERLWLEGRHRSCRGLPLQ